MRFYDVDTGKVVAIPASELAPGAVRAEVQGIDGIVWLRGGKLKASPFQHPPFAEPVRDDIRRIQAAFAEQRPLSFEEWEDGFRRDRNADQEIAIWVHAASVYAEFAGRREWSVAERADGYGVVGACTNASPETVWRIISLSTLSRRHAESIVSRYYGKIA